MEECSINEKSKNYSYYFYTNSNSKSSSNNINKEGREEMMIRKGPWKAEEDQVLIKHVQKYGPRDWSSIRSKGLLQRTGKSCRLRWVNKLRPDLKIGCKFTAEEERVVIELQAQIGNKWARIATHLAGRTDNDVKNFWSSRQKRLARLLHSQSPPRTKKHKSSASSTTNSRDLPHFPKVINKNSSIMEGESSSKTQPLISSSSSVDYYCPSIETNNYCNSNNNNNNSNLQAREEILSFPSIPNLQTELYFVPGTQELIDELDCSFLPSFECSYEPALVDDGLSSTVNLATPAVLFSDDFPLDVFDQI